MIITPQHFYYCHSDVYIKVLYLTLWFSFTKNIRTRQTCQCQITALCNCSSTKVLFSFSVSCINQYSVSGWCSSRIQRALGQTKLYRVHSSGFSKGLGFSRPLLWTTAACRGHPSSNIVCEFFPRVESWTPAPDGYLKSCRFSAERLVPVAKLVRKK